MNFKLILLSIVTVALGAPQDMPESDPLAMVPEYPQYPPPMPPMSPDDISHYGQPYMPEETTPTNHVTTPSVDEMPAPGEEATTMGEPEAATNAPETTDSAITEVSTEAVTTAAPMIKPPVIELIEEVLAAKARPLDKQTAIINAGKVISEGLTAKIVGPVVIFNSKVAAAAGALPPLMAAQGAIIGSAIATPIEIGAVAGSSIVSGVTGKLVAIPINLAAGAAAQLVGAAERGEKVVQFNLEHGGEILRDGLIRIGHIILKPIAVVVGAQTAITGAGLGITGTGIKGVGVGIEAVGAKMVGAGLTAKALGNRLIKAQFPPYLK